MRTLQPRRDLKTKLTQSKAGKYSHSMHWGLRSKDSPPLGQGCPGMEGMVKGEPELWGREDVRKLEVGMCSEEAGLKEGWPQ